MWFGRVKRGGISTGANYPQLIHQLLIQWPMDLCSIRIVSIFTYVSDIMTDTSAVPSFSAAVSVQTHTFEDISEILVKMIYDVSMISTVHVLAFLKS